MILLCLTVLAGGLLAGAVAHYVFGKSPDPHEVAVGKAVLQYLSIGGKNFPTDYYRANFKSYLMGDGQLFDATANTLPKTLYHLFDQLFGVFRSRGAHVQRLNRELTKIAGRSAEKTKSLVALQKAYAQVCADLAIYKDQTDQHNEIAATITRRLLLDAKDLVDHYE